MKTLTREVDKYIRTKHRAKLPPQRHVNQVSLELTKLELPKARQKANNNEGNTLSNQKCQ